VTFAFGLLRGRRSLFLDFRWSFMQIENARFGALRPWAEEPAFATALFFRAAFRRWWHCSAFPGFGSVMIILWLMIAKAAVLGTRHG